MTTSPHYLTAAAGSVHFANERLVMQLVDGRELSVPLEWFPRLREASEAERTHWRLIGQGTGIHWPDVDEDISVPRLLGLPCE